MQRLPTLLLCTVRALQFFFISAYCLAKKNRYAHFYVYNSVSNLARPQVVSKTGFKPVIATQLLMLTLCVTSFLYPSVGYVFAPAPCPTSAISYIANPPHTFIKNSTLFVAHTRTRGHHFTPHHTSPHADPPARSPDRVYTRTHTLAWTYARARTHAHTRLAVPVSLVVGFFGASFWAAVPT